MGQLDLLEQQEPRAQVVQEVQVEILVLTETLEQQASDDVLNTSMYTAAYSILVIDA